MRVTICKPAEQLHNAPAFDRHQFAARGRLLNSETGVSYSDLQHLRTRQIADLRKGRRRPTPDWANSASGLQNALLNYLESRFRISETSGSAKARLERCREAARANAKDTKIRLDSWIRNYRAVANKNYHLADDRVYTRLFLTSLRGETPAKLLARVEKQIMNLDGETFAIERAPEIVLSVLYHYFRLGLDSPSVGEILGIKAPAVRQIIHRVSKRAVRKADSRKRRKRRTEKDKNV